MGGACGPTGSTMGSVVRRRSGAWWRFPFSSALVQAVAVAVHLQDVDMVSKPIQQRPGQALGTEHLCPFIERKIGCHQGGAAFIALAEHLEQQLGAGLGPMSTVRTSTC